MKKIKLTQGEYALVDDANFPGLSQFKWFAWHNKSTNSFYAVRNIIREDGNRTTVYMHRVITKCPIGLVVDHADHNTLNNQKNNLRVCTYSQNGANRRGLDKNNTSGIRGVFWDKKNKKWFSSIGVNGKFIYLGRFSDKNLAAESYRKANKKYFGEHGGRFASKV